MREPKASQRLRNCSRFSREINKVPSCSPCRIRVMALGSVPDAMIMLIPELVAAFAA